MLVLSRKSGESIQIGDAVVTVVRSRNGTVRLAIEAPREVPIVRTELRENRLQLVTAGAEES